MMHAPVLVEDQLDSVPLDPQEFVEALLALPDEAARRRLLVENVRLLTKGDLDELAKRLKKETDQLMWADIDRCLQVAELIGELANTVANPEYWALSLLAQGNAFSIGLGEYARSITCYDEAAAIYEARDQHVQQAQSQIGKIYALANLGRYDEALATGNWASEVFRAHKEWLTLAKITVNLAIIHGRLGQDGEALELFDQARELYHRLGSELEDRLLTVESNRAIVLRNLGGFLESIEASNKTLTGYHELGQTIAVAQARQSLALTYFVMGRYNEALNLLNEARDAFLADGRERHAMLVELFISDCFLQLRRFPDVLEKCRQVREVFAELGTHFEVGQAILNEACAYVGLKQYDKALASLTEARHLFEQEGNHIAVADTNLQVAAVLLHQAQPDKSFLLTQSSAAVFEEHELPVGQARAYLVAAQAALALGRHEEARDLVDRALRLGEDHRVLTLTYQGHRLRGKLEVKVGHKQEGLAAYEQAIQELERLSGRLMIEYRADFIEDKARIYEDAVLLCLDLNWPSQGLAYSERAKSRALQDLVALRLNLRVEARSKTDRPLVEELHHLRSERDRLYRRREAGESMAQRGHMDERFDEQQRVE